MMDECQVSPSPVSLAEINCELMPYPHSAFSGAGEAGRDH